MMNSSSTPMGSRNFLHTMVDEQYFLDKLVNDAQADNKVSLNRLQPNNQTRSPKSVKKNLDETFIQSFKT